MTALDQQEAQTYLSPTPHSHSLNPSPFFPEIADLQPAGGWGRSLPGPRASDFAGATLDGAPTFAKDCSTLWA
jgi:hypothetical protein